MAVVFDADFTSTSQWTAGCTSAYPRMGPTNRSDHKLDYLSGAYCPAGVFEATRRPADGLWTCNLLTTEGSPEGFQVCTGDELSARITLPVEMGAWPSIWTWRDGGNEVDVFEYHPDHPDLLEMSNHVRGGFRYWDGGDRGIAPGGTFPMRVVLGANSVDWYIGEELVYADLHGVGPGWHAYLIVNLSVADGTYHDCPRLDGPDRLSWVCHSLRVER